MRLGEFSLQKNTKKIFLIEPDDKSKYQTLLIFSDTADMARHAASSRINRLKSIEPNESTPLIDPVYIDENLSTVQEISPQIINEDDNSVKIKYLDNEYILTINFAIPLINDSEEAD